MTNATPRREVLATIGAAVGVALAAPLTTSSKAQTGVQADTGGTLKVVDFHNHFVGRAFTPRAGLGAPGPLKQYFDEVNRKLADSEALLASIEQAGFQAGLSTRRWNSSRIRTPTRRREQLSGLTIS